MARANTKTIMSLDHFAEVVGLDPLAFNGVRVPDAQWVDCEPYWYQYGHQSGLASREDLARAIAAAEAVLESYIGCPPAPDWRMDELQLESEKLSYLGSLIQTRGFLPSETLPSLQLHCCRVIAGGRRTVELLSEDVAVDLDDPYGVGYYTTASVTFVSTEEVTPPELYLVPAGSDWSDDMICRWGIRGLRTTILAGNQVYAEGSSGRFVRPELWEAGMLADPADPDSFLETVDVYRVRNSAAGANLAPVEFAALSRTGTVGELVQTGALYVKRARAGVVSVVPANWTAAGWSRTCLPFAPEVVRVYYQCGYPSDELGNVAPPLDRAVAALATALLERPVCACGHGGALMEHWQQMPERPSFAQANCPFGPKNGAYHAYLLVKGLMDISSTAL